MTTITRSEIMHELHSELLVLTNQHGLTHHLYISLTDLARRANLIKQVTDMLEAKAVEADAYAKAIL